MELGHDDVLEILEVLERSDVEYLELEVGGTRLVADRTGAGVVRQSPVEAPPSPVTAAPPTGTHAPVIQPEAKDMQVDGETPESKGSDLHTTPLVEDGLVTVMAPMVGTFYRAPEPGAPFFVEVGAEVDAESTVGLIEVMKMFNSVAAGTRGTVVDVLVDNEGFVEYGQALMTIRPESTA